MVAIVTGNSLGLQSSSVALLGSRGLLGNATVGRGGENVYVNAATGNLVVQRTDEMLIGLGPDDVIARAYNSKGTSTDNWRLSVQRSVTGLTGTLNTVGSTITRTDWDGAQVVYGWSASRSAYIATDGGGAYDKLTYNAGVWTWADGNSLVVERYDEANGGRILTSADNNGNTLTFSYNAGGQVSRVTTADGYYTDLVYTGTLLTQVVTGYKPDGAGSVTTLTRVRYGYDTSNRLTTVTVDLSPTDNDITDAATYVTTYTYSGTSNRIASIAQSDGSLLQIAYIQPTAGDYRVGTLTETISSGVTRVTTIGYNTATRTTTVTDPYSQVTSLVYDAAGQLTQITAPPAVAGEAAQVTTFTYNANGDVLTAAAGSNVVTYTYDAFGNVATETDLLGNGVVRSYTNAGQLTSELHYGPGSSLVLPAYFYFYDSANRLQYSLVGFNGGLTATTYEYDGYGRRTGELQLSNYAQVGNFANAPTAALTASWFAGLTDKSGGVRTDTTYDFRGNVASVTTYGKLLVNGQGDTSDPTEVSRTSFIYDQAGNLLNRVTLDGAGDPAGTHPHETFVYDGLGRLVASTDLRGYTTSIAFSDAARKTIVTLASGLVQTSVYDAIGNLLSFTSSAGTQGSSVTNFTYDKLGRLLTTSDPTSVKSQQLYDKLGRKVADLDADGSVVEYIYNSDNLLVRTIRYKTLPTAAQISAATGSPTTATIAALRPVADANDSWEWRVYDTSGRLVETIDPTGAATEYVYDGYSRLVATTQYATQLDVAALKAAPPTAKVLPAASATFDRTARNFYDRFGQLIGVLDAEGYLTEMVYDNLGRQVETIRYATATTGNRASDDFSTLQSTVVSGALSAKDIHNRAIYDGQNRLRATVDGEGDIVRYNYTADGDVREEIHGQKLAAGVAATLANVAAAAASGPIETTTYVRDASGRATTMTRSLTGGGTETTTYGYDTAGNLISTSTVSTQTPTDVRATNREYDLRGRLIRELSGEGSAALAALGATPTATQINTVYNTYGVRYTYDAADRLVYRIDPNGTGTSGLRTLYYYNKDGQLTHTVNAANEVTERRYDNLGRLTDTIVYAAPVTPVAGMDGGLVNTTLLNAVAAIANPALDSVTHLDYDARDLVTMSTDATGATTAYGYSAFGQQTISVAQLDATSSVVTTQAYDRRGLLLATTRDAETGGLQLTTQFGYDAFGRVLQTIDPNGASRSSTYDRAGRTITTTDALNRVQSFAYDARGAVVSFTDRENKTTTYAYTAFNRQVTVTTPEGIITTSVANAYGQTISVTDGAGRVTTYTYDKSGALKTKTDAAGTETRNYDKAERLVDIIDATGLKTSFTYDAANRVLNRKVNSGGMNLTTSYAYDTKGQQISVTDATRVVTIAYDKVGRQTTVTVDPAGLAIATVYAYDKAGRVLTVTEAAGTSAAQVTQYSYDKADRRTKTQVDPAGLNLTTNYTYDKNGNVTAAKDATDKITRYVYDAEGRLTWTVDAVGAVTVRTYDGEGRVASVRLYANQIAAAALGTLSLTPTSADITAAVATSANDEVTIYLYNGDGQLRYSLDTYLRPTKYIYDGSGNLIRTRQGLLAIPATGTYTIAYVDQNSNLAPADKRVSRTVYDGANRAIFTIDAMGQVTAFSYDAAGRVIKVRQYETAYVNPADTDNNLDPSLATMQAWSAGLTGTAIDEDRTSRTLYDTAGRPVYAVDAEGYVTETRYDSVGRVTKTLRYAAKYSTSDGTTAAGLKSTIGTAQATLDAAATTTYAYDAAGRLTDVTNAEGVVTHLVLDAQGRITDSTVAYQTADAATTHRVYEAAGRLASETLGYGTAEAATTTYAYDGLGRVTTITNARGFTTTYAYDAVGHIKTETVQLDAGVNAVTAKQYDAFGNLVKVTDPRNNVGYFYYDKLNQLVLQVDPEGYYTKTEYSVGGEVTKVTRGAVKVSAPTVGVMPTVTANAADQVTTFVRDRLDRVTSVTDAENYTETYTLNAFGDRTAVTNKLLATKTYVYDKRGLMLTEVLPVGSTRADGTTQSATITNKYEYDARGNRTKTIEAYGLTEQRTTLFAYDRLDRLIQESGDSVQVLSEDLGTTTSVTPISTIAYDKRGNIVQTVDQAGARTISWFDHLDRKVSQVDGVGTLHTWTYDLAGNVASERVYADPVAITPSSPTGSWTADTVVEGHIGPPRYMASGEIANVVQEWTYDCTSSTLTEYAYNAAGEVGIWDGTGYRVEGSWIPTSATPGTYSGDYSVRAGTYGALAPTDPQPTGSGGYRETLYTYDRNNRLVASTVASQLVNLPANGNALTTSNLVTQTVYDAAGNVVQVIDPNGRSVFSFYDKAGHKVASVDQENYLTSYTLDGDGNVLTEERFATRVASAVTTSSDPVALRANVAKTADDRITVFTYDRNGHRLTEQRNGVASYTINATTGVLSAGPTSALITYAYDGLGNVTRKTEATGDYIDYAYDGLGRQTSATASAFTDYTGASVRTMTETKYNGLNDLTRSTVRSLAGTATTDQTTTYTYAGGTGRLLTVTDAAGFTRTYAYDVGGRVLRESYVRTKSDGATVAEANVYRYDQLGRVISQGTASYGSSWTLGDQTQVKYNAYGEVVAKGVNGGWQEKYDYDSGGRLWRSTAGDGVIKLYVYDGAGKATQTLTSSGADLSGFTTATIGGLFVALGAGSVAGVTLTYSTYDKRGQQTGSVEARRELTAGGGVANLTSGKTYNAFGEVASETDARGYTTNFAYNTLGKLVQKKSPQTTYTAENGAVISVVPTETYAYDISGRLLGVTDANGNLNSRLLLAGSGYGGDEALVTAEFHADHTVSRVGFDVYGDARKFTNELGFVETRTYDKMGRTLTVTHPTRGAAGALVDTYTYDGLGQQLSHANSVLGASVKETTDYDRQGRVIKTVSYAGDVTSYTYSYNGVLSTNGLGVFGGWTKITNFAGGTTSIDRSDYFGRTTEHIDQGGHRSLYSFDKAGRIASQDAGPNLGGRTLVYSYFNTGKVATLTDTSLAGVTATTTYGYDANGNRTIEQYSAASASGGVSFQNATSTYDALNRLTSVVDSGYANSRPINITYAYDAVGNIRRMRSVYTSAAGATGQVQDYWYKYDSMNRFVTTKGSFDTASNAIVRGAEGVEITYDAAGNRATATTTITKTETVTTTVPAVTVPGRTIPAHYAVAYYIEAQDIVSTYYNGGYYYAVSVTGEVGRMDGTGRYLVPEAKVWVEGAIHPGVYVPEHTETRSYWVDTYAIPQPPITQPWAVPAVTLPNGRTIPAHASYSHYLADDEIAYLNIDQYASSWGSYVAEAISYTSETGEWDGTGYWHKQVMVSVPQPDIIVPGHTEYYNVVVPAYTTPATQDPGYYTTAWRPEQVIAARTISQAYTVTSQQSYSTGRTEHYSYTEDGYLLSTTVNEGTYAGGMTAQVALASDTRDLLGRVTEHYEYTATGALAYSKTASYDSRSNVTADYTNTLGSDSVYTYTSTTYTYAAGGGPLTLSTSASTRSGQTTNTRTNNTYVWWDSAVVSAVSYSSGSSSVATRTWYTYYTYDNGGNLVSASVNDGFPRTMTYVTDAMGQVMMRQDIAGYGAASGVQAAIANPVINTGRPVELYYYFNNLRVGDVGNDGAGKLDYAATINARGANHTPGQVFTGRGAQADFDQSYDPISPTSQGDASSTYTAKAGDTLNSIATAMWGDASLWYLIADANGLSGPGAIAAGMRLVIPNKVANLHNNNATFRPYDPNQAMGETSPTNAPAPVLAAKAKKGCGVVGQILMVVVAVVVTALTYGALTAPTSTLFGGVFAGATSGIAAATAGAIAAAAGSIASQAFGVATGNQDKFSWKSVAMAAVTAAVGGVGPVGSVHNVEDFAIAVAKGAANNAISQSIGVVIGVQDKFSWTNVAVAGVVAGVSSAVDTKLTTKFGEFRADSWQGMASTALSGSAGAIAGAAAHSLIDGSDFGKNLMTALPDVISSTIGNAIAGGLQRAAELAERRGEGKFGIARDVGEVRPIETVGVEGPITGSTPRMVNEQLSYAPFINASDLSYDYSGSGAARTITAGAARRPSSGDRSATAGYSAGFMGAPGTMVDGVIPIHQNGAWVDNTRLRVPAGTKVEIGDVLERRGGEDRLIRKIYIANKDFGAVALDYKPGLQQELFGGGYIDVPLLNEATSSISANHTEGLGIRAAREAASWADFRQDPAGTLATLTQGVLEGVRSQIDQASPIKQSFRTLNLAVSTVEGFRNLARDPQSARDNMVAQSGPLGQAIASGDLNRLARLSGEYQPELLSGALGLPEMVESKAVFNRGRLDLDEIGFDAAESETLSPFTQRYLSESGGRWGSTATREQNYAITRELDTREYTFGDRPGGGLGPEEYIAGPGGGSKGGSYVDITATAPNGRTVRIQTVTTRADGVTPTASEAAAAARIRAAFPNDKLILVPKRVP